MNPIAAAGDKLRHASGRRQSHVMETGTNGFSKPRKFDLCDINL